MSPYYEHDGITIYHGDCREILPTLDPVDHVVTDPPWLACKKKGLTHRSGFGVGKNYGKRRGVENGDLGVFDPHLISAALQLARFDCLIHCGYMELSQVLELGQLRGVLGWHNTNAMPLPGPLARRDLSFVVWLGIKTKTSAQWPSCIHATNGLASGCMATERIQTKHGYTAHPAQEPLSLYRWLLHPLSGQMVLDPFMGTGTTLRAAKDLGRRAIGIEIEERYCEIAANRLAQKVLDFGPPDPVS